MSGLLNGPSILKQNIEIAIRGKTLEGSLAIPRGARSLVLFVHGSGSSRFSPRNQFVARTLNSAGLATLLFDLLTAEEEETDIQNAALRFDIRMLAERVEQVTLWLSEHRATAGLEIGYFGASTGAAAALVAASKMPAQIKVVVSRGGRPDLAGMALGRVKAPTLFIVGEDDHPVLELNREALNAMPPNTMKSLKIVPDATHLFDEPGTLELAADHACRWFNKYLPGVEYDR